MPVDVLRQVWQNTTQPDIIWDLPIYEEFFRTVRTVNASLPKERRLRVLLGDPPIDWDSVRTAKDYGNWDRDGYPAELIGKEVLAKGRKALVIYGDLHFIRKNPQPRGDQDPAARSIVGLLEGGGASKTFSIRTIAYGIDLEKLQPDVLSWQRPSLTLLRGTVLGVASFSSYYPRPLLVGPDGKPVESPEERRPIKMEEQFDALLYLGPQSTITRSQLLPSLCTDAAYMEMRMGRMELVGMQRGIDRLKQHCGAQAARDAGPLAERLLGQRAADWLTVDIPGVAIYVRRGTAAESDAKVIAQAVTTVRRELLALLGGARSPDTSPRAHLFFVGSKDETQRLMGRPVAGFIQEGESTGVIVYTRDYRMETLLRHELTHLYTFQLWGAPRGGTWLVEGVAAWTVGRCQGHTPDELAAGALARRALVPVGTLATDFRNIPEDVAMSQAGSIVGFLVRRRGLEDIRDRWKRETPHGAHPLGADGARLEREWLGSLAGVRPATLDIPRVIKEGC